MAQMEKRDITSRSKSKQKKHYSKYFFISHKTFKNMQREIELAVNHVSRAWRTQLLTRSKTVSIDGSEGGGILLRPNGGSRGLTMIYWLGPKYKKKRKLMNEPNRDYTENPTQPKLVWYPFTDKFKKPKLNSSIGRSFRTNLSLKKLCGNKTNS